MSHLRCGNMEEKVLLEMCSPQPKCGWAFACGDRRGLEGGSEREGVKKVDKQMVDPTMEPFKRHKTEK
ncbi:hypothetical protein C4D60_Mb10t17800 [Musa balbisiana]|uniref:Uncharacterized protein n=1 Tax=Musa balbisiana TaxID=52838 RepID=A0A4S8IXV3_MUSBA|nr:hypothetical protein C4D60_Mb10t17800 [Musa balbisiana]